MQQYDDNHYWRRIWFIMNLKPMINGWYAVHKYWVRPKTRSKRAINGRYPVYKYRIRPKTGQNEWKMGDMQCISTGYAQKLSQNEWQVGDITVHKYRIRPKTGQNDRKMGDITVHKYQIHPKEYRLVEEWTLSMDIFWLFSFTNLHWKIEEAPSIRQNFFYIIGK